MGGTKDRNLASVSRWLSTPRPTRRTWPPIIIEPLYMDNQYRTVLCLSLTPTRTWRPTTRRSCPRSPAPPARLRRGPSVIRPPPFSFCMENPCSLVGLQ